MQIWKQFSPNPLGPQVREVAARDRERLFFLMGMMLKCGQTTEAAVRAVGKAFKSEGKDDLSSAMHAMAQKVAQGKPLSKAMEPEDVLFDDVHRAAIIAGEASNQMQKSFEILQMLEDKKIEQSRSGMAEIITPVVLMVLSFVSLFNTGLNTLPVMAQLQKAQGKTLNTIPEAIMNFTHFLAGNWYLFAASLVILLIVAYSMLKSTQGKFMLDSYTLKVPILGTYVRYKIYSSMLLYFPHLISSGVKPKQMIPIMEALTTNQVLKKKIDSFNQVITSGGNMSEAMEKAGFPSIIVTPVAVSENYAGQDTSTNNVMIEGMHHSYNILERVLTDTHKRFVTVFSVILWIMGGAVMLLDMLAIVMAQG